MLGYMGDRFSKANMLVVGSWSSRFGFTGKWRSPSDI